MDKKLTILVVGGHPADVFDHCGGTLAKHIANGDRVVCLALTQGLNVHDIVITQKYRNGIPEAERADFEKTCREREEIKYRETREACACFGIDDVRFLSYSENFLFETNEGLINGVAKIVREVKPNVLITHFPFEGGGLNDHAVAARIAMRGAGLAHRADFENNIPGWSIAQTFFMIASVQTQSLGLLGYMHNPYIPVYVDVSDVIDKKVRALFCMKSQQYDNDYATKRTEVNEGAFGHHTGTAYAEAFVPAGPTLYNLLPVSEVALSRENEPEINSRLRGGKMTVPYMEI